MIGTHVLMSVRADAQRRGGRQAAAWVVAALVCALGGAVAGGAEDFSFGPQNAPADLVTDNLIRYGRQVLAGAGDPRADQLTRARILLDLASQISPDDSDILGLRVELAQRLGDRSAYLQSLRLYCRQQPGDDAAQLALTMALLEQEPGLRQRAKAVRRLLEGERADRFTAALRSRLSSYVARAHGEAGDRQEALARVKDAFRLDPSNQDAAAVAYELVASHKASPLALGKALLLRIRAEPLNAQRRLELGHLLLSQGAYAHAAEQYQVAEKLGAAPSVLLVHGWALSLAANGQTDAALTVLDAIGAEVPPATKSSDDAPLPPELELLRLAILHDASLTARVRGALDRLGGYFRPRAATDANAAAYLAWLTATFAPAAQEAAELIGDLQRRAVDNPLANRARGWYYLRLGDLEKARQHLRKSADIDPWARYGLALAAPEGTPETTVRLLRQMQASAPATTAGLLATRRLVADNAPPTPLPTGAGLVADLAEWKLMVRRPDPLVRPWVTLQIDLGPAKRFRYLDPIVATVQLGNATSMPLALGPQQTVRSTLFVLLTAQVDGAPISELAPLVVDLQRRLRLEPGETIAVPIRLDRGALGTIMALRPGARFSISATAVLDPVLTPDGSLTAGPLGAAASAGPIERRGLPPTEANVNGWLADLDDPAATSARLRTVVRLMRIAAGDVDPQRQAKIAATVDRTFATLGPLGQALVLGFMPVGTESEAQWPGTHKLAQATDDPLVRICYLARHVRDQNSPLLHDALQSDDPNIADFAKALHEGLRQAQDE